MELDEFVDMDWLNSHSSTTDIKDESFDTSDPFYYMDSTFEPDFMSQDIVTDPELDALDVQSTQVESTIKPEEQPAMAATPTSEVKVDKPAATALPPSFPSTEQIKLLIEAAKKQLALQQQQQQQSASMSTVTPSETQLGIDTAETAPITTVSPDKLTIKQEEDKSVSSDEFRLTPERSSPSFGRRNSKMDYDSDEEIHSPEDIKKMTPKERRQLRNKISARNFRVRRKGEYGMGKRIACSEFFLITHALPPLLEYISTLEAQVQEHKSYADQLFEKLSTVENENICLKAEVDSLRRQNQLLATQHMASPPSPPTSSDLVRTASNSSNASTSSSSRISSPRINLNKDLSITGSKAIDTYRQDTRILVSNAVIPTWNVEQILKQDIKPDDMLFNTVAQYIVSSIATFMLMDIDNIQQPRVDPAPTTISPAYMEYLYDTVIMSSLGEKGSSFRWWNVAAC
ncbi:hypothetical protein INT44_006979 [Umbelopsis vinacea]|uniref:BZIP domain-containing protein n=1 Tax=Umbelopsis vinacea TaxID=44442 RepID=A0A8H7PFI9_9FUNG|nr:hypothetical protein INT44_006979 [Umbelopsis vinacea]